MKNGRKILLWTLVIINLAGCATMQRKFTRKAKEPKHTASVIPIEQGPYQKKFSNEFYYKSHFTLWKTWQSELIDSFGENRKKVARAGQEALSHLNDMRKYFLPEKQSELDVQIRDLEKIVKKTDAGIDSASEIGPLRMDLEKIRRVVSANFYFDKVKDQMAPETVDLGN